MNHFCSRKSAFNGLNLKGRLTAAIAGGKLIQHGSALEK